MKKRIISFVIALMMVAAIFPFNAFAAEIVDSGQCGDNAYWTLDSDGTLTISGTGAMWDWNYTSSSRSPWYENNSIKTVVIKNGITTIGNYAFYQCESLSHITISSSVTVIGKDAFFNCSSLISVSIPYGMKTIRAFAFCDCKSMTSVSIPGSVTSIGDGAFQSCNSLSSITIPDSITTICYGMFWGCISLTSVKIPDSVKMIRKDVFANCTSLTSVAIPNGVTLIEDGTFFNCSSLTSVAIPNSVTSIGASAFEKCSSLTSVTISGRVTSIGQAAFEKCSSLTSVTIPESLTTIEDCAFEYCTSLKYVYYSGSESQWKGISIGWYNTSLTWAKIFFNSRITKINKFSIPSNKYDIHVVDENGYDIPDANILWLTESSYDTSTTDANGMAYFNRFTVADPTITVSKNGYTTWSNANTNWSKNENHFDTVVLYPSGLGSFKLVSAKYTNSKTASQSGYDILTKTKKLSLGNDASLTGDLDFGNFSLSVRAIDTSNVQKYVLYQNNNLIAESTSGDFNKLNTDRFSEGGGCFVRVYSKNGDKVDTNINLEFSKEEVNKTSELSIGADGISIAVGDSVPFLGGSTFSLELPIKPKITTKMSDTKIQFGFNLDLDGKSDDEQLEKAKKTIDEMKSVSKAYGMLTKQTFKSLAKEKNKADFFGDDCLEVTVLGYAEADLGSSTAKGTIIVEVSIKAVELEYNTVIVVVPVTVQTELSLTGQLSVEASYDWKNATLLGEFNGNIKPKLKAFGGVGFSKLVGVGAYGSAELDVAFHILPKPVYCRYVDLTGELGLKAYVGFLKYEKPFAHNTWHLYTAPSVASLAAAEDMGEPWYSGIYDSSQYTPDDLGYLAGESDWMGERASLMGAEAKTNLTPLLTDTYRNAQPVMISSGNALYAAFIRADAETGERYAACTKFDGLTWSEPVRIDGNAVLDDAPTLCADSSGNIWLAYAQTDPDWSGDSLTDYAESQSIVVGRLNPDTLKFTESAVYTGEGYAHMQELAVIDGVPALAWYDSAVTDDDSVLLPESGSIRTAIYENGRWSVKPSVPVDSAVKSLTVGEVDGEIAVGFVSGDTLFAAHADTATKLADNVTGRVSYGTIPGSDESDFLWNGGGELVTAGGSSVEIEGITNEYAILGDSVYYSKATENGAVLAAAKYAPNSGWSGSIQLTDGERYLENLSAAGLNGRDCVMGMNTEAVISEGSVEDAKDLVWSVVTPVSDLIIEGADFDRDSLNPGETVQVTVTVTNGGDHTADSVELTLDGEKAAVDTTGLNPGESREYVINMTCPAGLTEYRVSVSETDRDDYNPDDNEYTFSLGHGDAAVKLELMQIGDSKTVLATVKNEGIDTISGTALLYDANGQAATVSSFGSIKSGETMLIQYRLTEDFAGFDGGDVTVVLNTDREELYSYNNTDTLYIMETVRETAIQELIVEGGTLTASIFCAEDTEAKVFCAAYDGTGKMVSISSEVLTANEVNELTFAVPNQYYPNLFTIGDGFGLLVYFDSYESVYHKNGVRRKTPPKPKPSRK